jgi:hypothetical protein
MPRSDRWKPCHLLRPSDFVRDTIWGHDLSRESDPDADETWVRPYRFSRAPPMALGLFAAARLRPARGRWRSGLVTFDLWELRPEVTGVVLFTPGYHWVGNGFSIVERLAARDLARALGRPPAWIFPIEYEATVKVGRGSLWMSGGIVPGTRPIYRVLS